MANSDNFTKADEASTFIISKVVLSNFKRFTSLTVELSSDINIFAGDNETGKSTVMSAIDLTLSASRSRVENLGIEALLCKDAVQAFFKSTKKQADLPELFVELYFKDGTDPDFKGKVNSRHENAFGLRMSCEPSADYSAEISEVLAEEADNFPFEFYAIKFSTFGGQPVNPYSKPIKHLLIDGAQIDAEYAQREYTRALYRMHTSPSERGGHENKYRHIKAGFVEDHLVALNAKFDLKFQVRSSIKSNLESDLQLAENGVPLEARGRGRQALIKTEFALNKATKTADAIGILLLEEPENHLSHVNMRRLLDSLAKRSDKQLFVSTHSSMVCSRLDLRKVVMMPAGRSLHDVDSNTADFFCKAPDNYVLEFAMSSRVILVEGDAEFILIAAMYEKATESTLEKDGVHVIAVGGTSFKRYLNLAKILGVRTAVVRDNDGNYEKNCVTNYADLIGEDTQVFADKDEKRSTFEICLYEDNKALCDELFSAGRRTLTPLEWMLSNKAEAALSLLKNHKDELKVPAYLHNAIAWARK
jgi:putative ATP-dependent endonuclease of OLD family